MRSVDRAVVVDGQVRVTVTAVYEPWCCTEAHEVTDAVVAVSECFRFAHDAAEFERTLGLRAGRTARPFPYPADDGWFAVPATENLRLRDRVLELEEQVLRLATGLTERGADDA